METSQTTNTNANITSAQSINTLDQRATLNKLSGQPDSYYRNHAEKLDKENKQLKARLDTIERENRDLKKSLYDLSFRYDHLSNQMSKPLRPFNIDNIVTESDSSTSTTPKGSTVTPFTSGPSSANTSSRNLLKKPVTDSRHLYCKQTLKGHNGAVYSVLFSPCGKYIASGSFDKSVRVWDSATGQQLALMQDHQLSVSDVSWSHDSQQILSGSLDHSAKIWDAETSKLLSSHDIAGFTQTVEFDSKDSNIFFAGCTHRRIYCFDRRQAENSTFIENDSMINSLYIYRDGFYIISGDSHGCIKTWDKRKGAVVSVSNVSSEGKHVPISSVHVTKASRTDEEGRYLGVNCYDNILRVYDRGTSSSVIANPLSTTRMELLHSMSGHKNKNWPITSSFFVGKNRQLFGHHNRSDSDSDHEVEEEKTVDESFLLATGSADNQVYIYNVTGHKESHNLLQKLEGHTDRVYAVNFHPFDPILATASADSTVRLWSN